MGGINGSPKKWQHFGLLLCKANFLHNHPMFVDRFVTQLCLHFWSGGKLVLFACPQVTLFWLS